jgi:hypothetical protein
VREFVAYLGVELVEDVLEVVAFDGLLGVEKFEEILDELRCHVDFERADLDGLVDDELKEKFVDALQVGPRGIHFFFLVNTCLSHTQV